MALSDTATRKAKSGRKPVKLADERGLYLLVNPAGSKYWRFKYRFGGKEKLLALGVYPDVSLASARTRRDEARKALAGGADPGMVKKAAKQAVVASAQNSFKAVALEWFGKFSPTWAANHSDKILSRLKRDVFPWLGDRPISEITAQDLLAVLRREVLSKRRIVPCKTADRYSAMPSLLAGHIGIAVAICGAR